MRVRYLAPLLCALLLPGMAQAAVPETLDCTNGYFLDWHAETPAVFAIPRDDDELGGITIHLDPGSGEWHLAVDGSAALTQGGGTFEIIRSSAFEEAYDEWVGYGEDAMLRIRGNGAVLPFVFISGDHGVIGGTCVEPAEPFLLLAPRKPML